LAVLTSPSAVLSHLANGDCIRSDDTREDQGLAAKNVDLTQRNQELERSLSESKTKCEELLTRVKTYKVNFDLERIELVQRASELERSSSASKGKIAKVAQRALGFEKSLSESETRSAEIAAKNDDLAQRNHELETFLSALKSKYEDSVTRGKDAEAKRCLEKAELARRTWRLETSLSESKEKLVKVAQRALGFERSLSEFEAKTARSAQELNDLDRSTTRKIAQLTTENFRLKNEVANYENAGMISASHVSTLKAQMEALRSNHQEALEQLASDAKQYPTLLDADKNQPLSSRARSMARETGCEACKPTKGGASGRIQVVPHVDVDSDSELTDSRDESACAAAIDRAEQARDLLIHSPVVELPSLASKPSSWQCRSQTPLETKDSLSNERACSVRLSNTDLIGGERIAANQHRSEETHSSRMPASSACSRRYSQAFAYPGAYADTISVLKAAGLYAPRTSEDANFISEWTFSRSGTCRDHERSAAIFPPIQASSEDNLVSLGLPQHAQNNGRPGIDKGTDEKLGTPPNLMSEGSIPQANYLPTPQATPKSARSSVVNDVVESYVTSKDKSQGLELGSELRCGEPVANEVDVIEKDPVAELAIRFERQLSFDMSDDAGFSEHH
jgi:hypothetical protein